MSGRLAFTRVSGVALTPPAARYPPRGATRRAGSNPRKLGTLRFRPSSVFLDSQIFGAHERNASEFEFVLKIDIARNHNH
jgi:hypothetical protein